MKKVPVKLEYLIHSPRSRTTQISVFTLSHELRTRQAAGGEGGLGRDNSSANSRLGIFSEIESVGMKCVLKSS